MDLTNYKNWVIMGLVAFVAGYIAGDLDRQRKVAEKIHELYEEGGCIIGPDDTGTVVNVDCVIIE